MEQLISHPEPLAIDQLTAGQQRRPLCQRAHGLVQAIHRDVRALGKRVVRQRLTEGERAAPGCVADQRHTARVAETCKRGDVAGDAVVSRRHHNERFGVRVRVQRFDQRRGCHAVLDVPGLVDRDRHDRHVQPSHQHVSAFRLVDVGGKQYRVAGASDRGEGGMQALGRAAGDEAAEVGVPRFCSDLMRPLDDMIALGPVVQTLGRDDVRCEHLPAEHPPRLARDGAASVMAGRAEAVDAASLNGGQGVEDGGLSLVHGDQAPA